MMGTSKNSPYALQVRQLSVNYDATPALWDVSFEIPPGVLAGILGPNGSGKTTLIKTAMGLHPSMSGRIEFFGQPLRKARGKVAYVPQRGSVDWDFPISVRELVLMGRYGKLGLLRWPRKADHAAAEYYLDKVGMLPYADRQISQLSGGQQQRIFIARALMQEADIFFLDEPFAGVDLATETAIMKLLAELKAQGKTIFVVHHDLNSVESYFDWVILLNMRLVACGKLKDVFTEENLLKTFSKSYALFDEALKLSLQKNKGLD